jgi:hypothetical protein
MGLNQRLVLHDMTEARKHCRDTSTALHNELPELRSNHWTLSSKDRDHVHVKSAENTASVETQRKPRLV